jgi:hypothetical protein
MSIVRRSATATLLGAAAGALLLGSPVASADDLATLPVPPYDPSYFFAPGTAGAITNAVYDDNGAYQFDNYDQAYTVSDGSYEIHDAHIKLFSYLPFYEDDSQQVIASDGVAPAVGTTWDNSSLDIPSFGNYLEIYNNSILTTPDGMVDELFTNSPWANIYYQGPAGTIDYLVHDYGAPDVSYTPVFDIPAAGDTAASINPADLAGLGDVTSLTTLATEIQTLF